MKNNNYIVYMHIFPNGKRYIGITCQKVERRWRKGKGYQKRTQDLVFKAIQHFGWDNIKHEILYQNLSKKEAELKEQELISEYNTFNRQYGYNRTKGGDVNPMIGKHHKKKALEALSKHFSGEKNPAAREVYQYDLNGNLIAKYKTAKEAAAITGINFVGISKCRAGTRLSAGGYIWRYNLEENVSKITHYRKTPILQYDLEGNFIKEWESITAASLGLTGKTTVRRSIGNTAIGKNKTSCGFIWKYK